MGRYPGVSGAVRPSEIADRVESGRTQAPPVVAGPCPFAQSITATEPSAQPFAAGRNHFGRHAVANSSRRPRQAQLVHRFIINLLRPEIRDQIDGACSVDLDVKWMENSYLTSSESANTVNDIDLHL